MKTPSFLLLIAALLACSPATRLRAQESAEHHHHKTTELGQRMETMKDAFRIIGRQVRDPAKNADSLQQVAIMHAAATEALQFQPEKTAGLPAADQAKFVADFHAGIKHLIADLDQLSAAFKAGDNEQAASLVRKIKADQKEGHKQFRKEHDHQ